jgi:tRNA threonylcarbamoyladenosine biosynthesis protein TsaB
MEIILCIETATPVCSVALGRDGVLLGVKELSEGYVHSEMLLPFIAGLLNETGVRKKEISAVSVSAGPGSYTGLRIGISAAKGLCYALDVPLISVPTLEAMAYGMRNKLATAGRETKDSLLFCPMIDARRMEVYTALYDSALQEVLPVQAMVVSDDSFSDYFGKHQIMFAGDGSKKCEPVLGNKVGADFSTEVLASAASMIELSFEKFRNSRFENLALFEPFYLKEFRSGTPSTAES